MPFSYMTLGFIIRSVSQAVVLIVSTQLFDQDVIGVATIAFATYHLIWPMFETGIGQTLIQCEAGDRKKLAALSALLFLVTIGVVALGLLALPVIDLFLEDFDRRFLALIAVVVIVRALGTFPAYSLLKSLDIRRYALIENGAYLIGFCAALGACWAFDAGEFYLLLGLLIYSLVATTLFLMAAAAIRPRWSSDHAGSLAHMAGGFTLASGLNSFVREGNIILVGAFLGAGAAGLFSRAFQLYMLGAFTVGQIFDRVLTPMFLEHREESGYNRRLFDTAIIVMFAGLVPLSTLLGLEADTIVRLLFGADWLQVAGPLQVLAIGLCFRATLKINESVLRAYAKVYTRVAYYVVWSLVLVLAAPLVFRFGLIGFGIAELVGVAVFWIMSFRLAAQLMETDVRRLLETLTMIAPAPVLLVLAYGAMDGYGDLLRLALGVVLLALVTAVAVVLLVRRHFGSLTILRMLL